MRMVAKKPNRYGGRKRITGAEADIPSRDVKLVTALGWFEPFEEPKPAPAPRTVKPVAKPTLQTRAMSADENAQAQPDDAPPAPTWIGATTEPSPAEEIKPKRTYQRRDMKAED